MLIRKIQASSLALALLLAPSLVVGGGAWAATAPVAAPEAQFEAGGATVMREGVAGKGAPLVLVPGLFGGAWSWDGVRQKLAQEHEVFTLTLPGFSGKPAVAGPLIDKAVADIVALIRQQKLDRPVLVGHSLGAFIAFRVASEHPDLVGGVVAVDGFPVFPPLAAATPEARRAAAQKMADQFGAGGPEQFRETLRGFLNARVADRSLVDGMVEQGGRSDPKAVGQYVLEMLPADLRPQLGKVRAPVLALAATGSYAASKDEAAIRAFYRDILANAPNAQVVLVRKSGHFVANDQPDALVAAIEAYLAGRALPKVDSAR